MQFLPAYRKRYYLDLPCADLKQAHALREFLTEQGVSQDLSRVVCFGGPPTVAMSFSSKIGISHCRRLAEKFFRLTARASDSPTT